MKISRSYLLTAVSVLLILCSPSAHSMINVLKGTYDCLQDEYGYASPYAGAVFYETGFLRNIYHYGPQKEKLDKNDKKVIEALDSTTAVVRMLFHEVNNDGQFIPSQLKDIAAITPELIGLIIGRIVKGDFLKNKKDITIIKKKWAQASGLDQGVISPKLDLIFKSCLECDTINEQGTYPAHTTESILLGFLYAKYLNNPDAQKQGKAYFVEYLTALNSVATVFKDDIKLDDETFLAGVYAPKQYEEFEVAIKDAAGNDVEGQISYMEKHAESALNAIIVRRFYASVVPKKVMQSIFGYKDQEQASDCLESALFDLLINLMLYDPATKSYDISLLPEGVKLYDTIASLIEKGIEIEYEKKVKNLEGKKEIIKEMKQISLTPQTINETNVRQVWYDFVSGKDSYKDNEGKPDSNKNIIYCRGKSDARYEND